VDHIESSALEPLFRARFKEFAMVDEQDAWSRLPLRLDDLRNLYLIVNYNLRDLLALADEYCDDIHAKGVNLQTDDQKAKRFAKWLEAATTMRYQALKSRLPADAWAILDLVMADDFRGTFGVGNFDSLNRNSKLDIARSTFEKRLRDLARFELISKSVDEESNEGSFKRDVFTVTAKGALVHYARLVKHENQGILPLTWLRRVNG
jgi:DNA-binding HxlR family transcriptional regulator